jgi:Siphovirus protein of unknown function (DUF859)
LKSLALSGSFQKDIGGGGWRIRAEWSATQSISGNYSTVTVKLYWQGLQSWSTTNTSASKNGSITINGNKKTFTFSAKITGTEKKLIGQHTVQVNHNSDGTKSFSMSAEAGINLTLRGTYYGNQTISSGTVSLNTIPRKSTLSSSASWTAGNNFTLTVSRKSSSFTHLAYIDIKDSGGTWRNIKSINFGSSTSISTSFTTAENTDIFKYLNGRAEAETRINLHTYNGGTSIGYNTYTGKVTAPSASTVSIENPTGISSADGQGNSTVWVDQDVKIKVSRKNSGFTHTIRFKDGNSGSIIHEKTGVGTSYTWSPTTSEMNKIYQMIPNSVELDGQIDVLTYYNGQLVRSATNKDINYRVRNSNPTFSSSQMSYKDTNSTTVGITGNNQHIIQNQSTLTAYIDSVATAKNYATIKEYAITINGVTKKLTGTGSVSFGTITSSSNINMKVVVKDSRGFTTEATKTITVIPYKSPIIIATAVRKNNFEESTTLNMSGTFSSVNGKNSVSSAQYRYKLVGSSTWSSWTSFSLSQGTETFSVTPKTITLDSYESYDVQFRISDKFTSNITVSKVVGAGQPLFFLDVDRKSIGVNKFPTNNNSLEIGGNVHLSGLYEYKWADGIGRIGRNQNGWVFFGNNTAGRWLRFPDNGDPSFSHGLETGGHLKSGGELHIKGFDLRLGYENDDRGDTGGSRALVKENGGKLTINFRGDFYGGTHIQSDLKVDGVIMSKNIEELWSGASYMHGGQIIYPSKKMSECANGWILVWSDYTDGKAGDYDFIYTFVLKMHVNFANGKGVHHVVTSGTAVDSSKIATKYLYMYDDHITGNDINDDKSILNTIVLRKVYSW